MRRIGWGRLLRRALKDQGIIHASKSDILHGMRQCGGALGAQAAEIFHAEVQRRQGLDPSVREAVALDTSAEIDTVIRSILREWRIPRSAESERLAEAAEAAFRGRLSSMTAEQGGAA